MPTRDQQQTFSNWQSFDPMHGSTAVLGPSPVFRNAKDQQLIAWGASPDVNFPDGYLGTQGATSRRSDKLLDAVHRTNQRNYSRGVHKGERINPGDYLWPKEFNLMTGLEYEAKGQRFAPSGAIPTKLPNDGKAGPRGVPRGAERGQVEFVDRQRQSMMSSLLPRWR